MKIGKITKVFKESATAYRDGKRLIANRGGTRSGKTYSLMQFLVTLWQIVPNLAIDVVSESGPHLKRGCMKDFEDLLGENKIMPKLDYQQNLTNREYTFCNGSVMRFFSADDWGKVKGSRRDVLFINEANRINWETYRQLAVRTTKCIFIDWNPDSEFWFEKQGLRDREDTVQIVTTYKDNPFLGAQQIAEIESYKSDPNWWKVYGLGEIGQLRGLVYTNWVQCIEIPSNAKIIGYGIDFGFSNDPTAVIEVAMAEGDLWLDEKAYLHGLTNDKIADIVRPFVGCKVADSAEMKSIQELINYGVRNIEPSIKGSDSVRNGIQILQRYRLHVTQRSLNLIHELRNYKWEQDKITGELQNVPIDAFNHALDAVRYVALNRLRQRRLGTARAKIMRN